jgi:hypothetical protein
MDAYLPSELALVEGPARFAHTLSSISLDPFFVRVLKKAPLGFEHTGQAFTQPLWHEEVAVHWGPAYWGCLLR